MSRPYCHEYTKRTGTGIYGSANRAIYQGKGTVLK